MGRYVTQADGDGDIVPSLMSRTLVAQITRDTSSATTIDTDVLDTHIESAEAEIDTFVGVRYALPLTSVPVLIRSLAARLTRYRLYTSRPGTPEEWLTDEYERDLATLREIRDGKRELGLTAAGADPGNSPNPARRVRAGSRAPVFGRGNMTDF